MNYNLNPQDHRGHIELQQHYLREFQERVSAELFGSGVASRLLYNAPPTRNDVEGVAQLDKLFVPSVRYYKSRQGEPHKILRLAVISREHSHTTDYVDLGEIDQQNFLRVSQGVTDAKTEDDAWAVYATALELETLQTGDESNPPTLPNLSSNLLSITNSYTLPGAHRSHQG